MLGSRDLDASIFSRVDVSRCFGTSSCMEKSRAQRQFALRVLAGLATSVVVAVLYFFPPAGQVFYPRCIFHSLTGLNCPFCGSLRATHQLLHGNFHEALALNPFFVLAILPVATAVFVLKFFTAMTGRKIIRFAPSRVSIWIFIGILATFGVLRNLPAFSWMSP